MHSRIRLAIPIVLLLAAAAGGYWWWQSQPAAAAADELKASGTIEATQIDIAPEVGARILTVDAAEGQSVPAGATLVTLDSALLQAQRAQAVTAVAQARAGLAVAEARLAQAEAGARPEELVAADARLAGAAALAAQAAAQRDALLAGPRRAEITIAEANLAQAEAALRLAETMHDASMSKPHPGGPDEWLARNDRDRAAAAVTAAQAQLDLVRAGATRDQRDAAAEAAIAATTQITVARSQLDLLAAGARAEDLAVLKASVEQARVAVEQAEAALAIYDVQLARYALTAPVAGTVLVRSGEPGEMATPGASLIVLSDLSRLEITVYVAEDRYGAIRLGQSATVTVDSYPGETFIAHVSHIADQAEFTPRNVQTVTGRKTTVFAIKLSIENQAGKLKPGMPADVDFGR